MEARAYPMEARAYIPGLLQALTCCRLVASLLRPVASLDLLFVARATAPAKGINQAVAQTAPQWPQRGSKGGPQGQSHRGVFWSKS